MNPYSNEEIENIKKNDNHDHDNHENDKNENKRLDGLKENSDNISTTASGSKQHVDWSPENELIMVAKLGKPIALSSDTDMTFIVRYDT